MKTVTVKKFSQKAKIPPETVREWCRKGRLKCLKRQGHWLISEKESNLWSDTSAVLRRVKKRKP